MGRTVIGGVTLSLLFLAMTCTVGALIGGIGSIQCVLSDQS